MSAAVPNNASLAYAVDDKDLQSQKKHLEHVDIEKAKTTMTGGVHLGPGKEQADFDAQEVGRRSAIAAQQEAARSHFASTSAVGSVARGGNSLVESSSSGEVSVQSSVTIDCTQETNLQAPAQIQSLLSRLSSTTAQVDEYSRRQNEAISKEANERIQRIISETQQAQDALLKDASSRSLEIEAEYSSKLKVFLQQLDASKAGNLAALEKDLNFRQEQLLSQARDEMDAIHAAATQAKIQAMNQANQTISQDVDRLTEQVKSLGEAEVERRLNSTTTTVITTQTSTDSHSRASASPDTMVSMDKTSTIVSSTNADLRTVGSEPRANTRV